MWDLDIGPLISFMAWMLAVFVPLGAWKLVDIAIFLFRHVHIS